jgi:hypothetical protein
MRRALSTAIAFCAAFAVPGQAEDLTLSVVSVKSEVLVGEPVVLGITVTSNAPIYLNAENGQTAAADWLLPYVRIMIDRGRGFELYSPPTSPGLRGGPITKRRLPDGVWVVDVTMVHDEAMGNWAFDRPGIYRIAVEYRDEEITGRSQNIELRVNAAPNHERQALQSISTIGPWAQVVTAPTKLGRRVATFVEQFPTSVYAHQLRVRDLEARYADLVNGRSGTEERLALLPTAIALTKIDSSFTPDALALVAQLYLESGDMNSAVDALRRVVQEYGGTAVSVRARAHLEVLAHRIGPAATR